jgi:hypothetical protein
LADVRDALAGPAELGLPAYPWWENTGLEIDRNRMAALAGDWCSTTGGEGGAPGFFFEALPVQAVGSICGLGGTGLAAEPRVLLGDLFLSGWYGGLWFRDHAGFGSGGGGPPRGPVSQEDFDSLAGNAKFLLDLAAGGTDEEIVARGLVALDGPPDAGFPDSLADSLLTLYAYNTGYVSAILDHPPADRSGGEFQHPCAGYLDCPLGGTPLEVYAPFRVALDRLAKSTDPRWTALASDVEYSKSWVEVGKSLWNDNGIDAAVWRVLVGINASYLRVGDVAVLAALLGYGDRDAKVGRCGILLEAASDTWNRAYFLALLSDAPPGTLPSVQCPDFPEAPGRVR